jgi:hypothetical protein
MRDYPVRVDVLSPPQFERVQMLLRIALAVVLAWFGITAGWLVWMLYGTLPLIAAIAISTLGSDRYLEDFAPRLWSVLAWLLRLSAFMALLVDRFPTGDDDGIAIEIRYTGRPTPGTALLRLLVSIPSGIVLCLLGCISCVLWLVAAVIVLLGGPVPQSILGYQRGMLRWQARLVAYHASLVVEYPPFSFESDAGGGTIATARVV